MKVAVTAVSGSLGNTIAEQLVKEIGKENVIGIARTPDKAKHLDIEIRKGDYNSRTDFDEALKGIDVVLIVSGMDHPEGTNLIYKHTFNFVLLHVNSSTK